MQATRSLPRSPKVRGCPSKANHLAPQSYELGTASSWPPACKDRYHVATHPRLTVIAYRRTNEFSRVLIVLRSQAPIPRIGSKTANVSRKRGNTPAMAKGTSTRANEHHSVQHARGRDPSAAREPAEEIQPADRHFHTHYANQCSLVSDENRVFE